MMAAPTDYVSGFVYENYVVPARERGDRTAQINTGQVSDALRGAYSQRFVGSVLRSVDFRNTCRLQLESAKIAATETYTFRLESATRG
jgi:hypothetical protein